MHPRAAFTLIELVVVVLLIGILTAVAAPRIFGVADRADESALRQTLLTLREAIEYHRAQVDGYPGDQGTEADFKADLQPFLRFFPKNPIKDSSGVIVQTSGAEITATVNGGAGWIYDNQSGQIVANSNGTSSDGSRYYQW